MHVFTERQKPSNAIDTNSHTLRGIQLAQDQFPLRNKREIPIQWLKILIFISISDPIVLTVSFIFCLAMTPSCHLIMIATVRVMSPADTPTADARAMTFRRPAKQEVQKGFELERRRAQTDRQKV